MAFLREIANGRIFTHLGSLFGWISTAMDSRSTDLPAALSALNRDPVYRSIAAREFRSAISRSTSTPAREFEARVIEVRRKAGERGLTDLQPFLTAADWFMDSNDDVWADQDYLTVPVMTGGDKDSCTGLVYLRAVPKLRIASDAGGLDIGDLTSDPRLLSINKNYFGTIASALMKTFFMVDTYTFDPDEYLARSSYRLCFGCQITEGKSMGAAVLAIFAITFLRTVLGSACDSAISPARGTLLTGSIDDDGNVLPVEHTAEKVTAAAEEYGPSIRLILPEGSRLPPEVEEKIDKGHVIYVETAQQLLAAVLSGGGNDHRGLSEARRQVFARLPEAHIQEMRRFLSKGMDPDVHRLIAQGSAAWVTPQSREGGVYVIAKSWRDRMEVRLGLEPSAVADSASQASSPTLVQVIVDGSEPMNAFWQRDQKNKVCKLTSILFEIASRIDEKREQLVVGFLSHREFYEVRAGTDAESLEAWLQDIRKRHSLPLRGPFFMPVYQASSAKYGERQKRIFILSDSFLPDWEDQNLQVSMLTRLRLSLAADFSSDDEEAEEAVLFPDGGLLDASVLQRHFSRERGAIKSLEILLGKELPVEWQPADGRLTLEGDCYSLQWRFEDAVKAQQSIRMAYQCPASLEFRGVLDRDGVSMPFRFREPCKVAEIPQVTTVRTGALTKSEFELWKTICSPGKACPICNRTDIHLLEENPMSFISKPVFRSLESLSNGWLALQAGNDEWCFFWTGCRLGGIFLVSVDGTLHWSSARGHLSPVESNGSVYSINTSNSEHYYICHLSRIS